MNCNTFILIATFLILAITHSTYYLIKTCKENKTLKN